MSRRASCDVCGDPMEARRSTRRFCSIRCRVRAARTLISVTAEGQAAPMATRAHPAAPASPQPCPEPKRESLSRLPLPIEVRVVLGERLISGGPSGKGGRVWFVVGGRSFDTPREAIDFASA